MRLIGTLCAGVRADFSAPPPRRRYLLGSWVSCGRVAGCPSGPLRSSAQGSPGAHAETGNPRCRGTCDGTGVRAAFLAPRGSGLGLRPAHFLRPCCQSRRRSPACGRSPAPRSLCSCVGISAPPPSRSPRRRSLDSAAFWQIQRRSRQSRYPLQ